MEKKVAILGVSGIGKNHARIFHNQGARICAILGSSHESSKKMFEELNRNVCKCQSFFHNIDDLIEQSRPDMLSICTPPETHYELIISAFNASIPVFCEKPIFWNFEEDFNQMGKKLDVIKHHPNRYIIINTCNIAFLERLKDRIPNKLSKFFFKFTTLGHYRGKHIASDLLPHAISLLFWLHDNRPRKVKALTYKIKNHSINLSFDYNGCAVKFILEENPSGAKDFVIGLNDEYYARHQEGVADTYRVALVNKKMTAPLYLDEDPFVYMIKRFLRKPDKDEFELAAANLRLMHHLLSEMEN